MGLKFRRGTTAQKSGSLAFGEPYVNTTLGTLQIGLDSGDVTLSALGTGSNISIAGISGSSLDITGNAKIDGNLTLGGNITIGDNTSDTLAVTANLSSSLIPSTTNVFDIGSSTKSYRTIYGGVLSGSAIEITSNNQPEVRIINTSTGISYHFQSSNAGNLNIHNNTTGKTFMRFLSASAADDRNSEIYGNLSVLTGSISATNGFTGSIAATNGVVSGSSQVVGILTSLNTFSGSENTKLNTLGLYTASVDTKFSTLQTLTASMAAQVSRLQESTASLNLYTSSNDTTNTAQNTRLTRLEESTASLNSLTGSYAKTNTANVFTGNQTITGSLYISQDLVVGGSSSVQTISSSRLDIGDNIILLNVASPFNRFGGLAIQDSGSANGISASILWDSVNNKFLYSHPVGADTYNSAWIISGPVNSGALGSETGLTTNKIQKATDDDHIGDSNITDTGTLITLGSNTVVNGTLVASGTTLVSASAQVVGILSSLNTYTGSNDTTNTAQNARLTTIESVTGSYETKGRGIVSGSAQIDGSLLGSNKTITVGSTSITLGGTATTIAGLTSVTSTGFTGALTGNASTVTNGVYTTDTGTVTNTMLAGSIADTKLSTISTAGKVSNSATTATSANTFSAIVARDVTGNFTATTITAALSGNASTATTLQTARAINGVNFDGSAAITITAAAGTLSGATLASGVTASSLTSVGTLTSLTVTGAITANGGVTVTGAITATGDITAYYTSDKRHKNNIQTIPNALEKVTKLNGVTWEWNDDVHEVTKSTPKTGLIAQEVQEVLPEVVKTRDDGFLALDYSKMMGLMVEAIKEQQTQIHSLTLEIEKLKESKGL
jgi:hypothetical protein